MSTVSTTVPGEYGLIESPEEFIDTLLRFHKAIRSKVKEIKTPVLGGQRLDFYAFYRKVIERGGLVKVVQKKRWREIADELGIAQTCTNAGYLLRKHYISILHEYEKQYIEADESILETTPTTTKARTDDDEIHREKKKKRIKADDTPVHAPTPIAIPRTRTKPRITYSAASLTDDKLAMAFKSGLDREIRWALNTMMLLSASGETPGLKFGGVPTLLDELIDAISPLLFDLPTMKITFSGVRSVVKDKVLFNTGVNEDTYDMAMTGLTIIRNMSFSESNAVFMADNDKFKKLVASLLNCGDINVRCDILDIVAAVAPCISLGNDTVLYISNMTDILRIRDDNTIQWKLTAMECIRLLLRNDKNITTISALFRQNSVCTDSLIDAVITLCGDSCISTSDAAIQTLQSICDVSTLPLNRVASHPRSLPVVLKIVDKYTIVVEGEEKEKKRRELARLEAAKKRKLPPLKITQGTPTMPMLQSAVTMLVTLFHSHHTRRSFQACERAISIMAARSTVAGGLLADLLYLINEDR